MITLAPRGGLGATAKVPDGGKSKTDAPAAAGHLDIDEAPCMARRTRRSPPIKSP